MRSQILIFMSGALPLLVGAEAPPTPSEAGTVRLESASEASDFALRHNPRLQALAATRSVALSERSAGRSLSNPEASAGFLGSGSARRWQAEALGDVSGLLYYPWQRGAAQGRYEAALADVALQAADLAREIRIAWVAAVAAQQTRSLVEQSAATWESAAELSRRQRAEGSLTALDLAETEAAATEARVAARRSGAEADAALENLARLIGIPSGRLELPSALPEPAVTDPAPESLEAAARTGNPELVRARSVEAAVRGGGNLATLESWPRIKAGIGWERDAGLDGGRAAFGPVVTAEIPLFDLGFAKRRRVDAERLQARRGVEAARADLVPEIRAQILRRTAARLAYEEGRGTLVPLRQLALKETLKRYNTMLEGVYRLLEARRAELASEIVTVEALRDYWIASAELERLTGAPRTDRASTSSSSIGE